MSTSVPIRGPALATRLLSKAAISQRAKRRRWESRLYARGVSATHPDDGWVDRKKNRVVLCYPQVFRQLCPGSIVVLGTPDEHRAVRLVSFHIWLSGIQNAHGFWKFEELKACNGKEI